MTFYRFRRTNSELFSGKSQSFHCKLLSLKWFTSIIHELCWYPKLSMLYNMSCFKTYVVVLQVYIKIDYLERKYVLASSLPPAHPLLIYHLGLIWVLSKEGCEYSRFSQVHWRGDLHIAPKYTTVLLWLLLLFSPS